MINKQVAPILMMSIEKRTKCSGQTKGNGPIPKDPDVPREGTNPKLEQDKLPTNGRK